MFLVHLLLPHHSNNHRPTVLHNPSLLVLLFIILFFGLLTSLIKVKAPGVLGIATDITIEKLVDLTNDERLKNGLDPLSLDPELSKAAQEKAKDMFYQNYWAHNSPDGKTPWIFIRDSGYQYIYAGENLARDFTNAKGVFKAWIASPGHRDNILSSNYQDIGFAVVNGKLNGEETTLVVQLFGSRKVGTIASVSIKQEIKAQSTINPLVDSKLITRNASVSILGFLIAVLAVDLVIANRKRLARLTGHNLDHIIFLGSLALVIVIEKRGLIL